MDSFVRKKDYLICIDSDGCAIDAMDIKHKNCFGPEMIKSYGLESYKKEVQTIWEDINLYTITRGINRFLALLETLKAVKENVCEVEDFLEFEAWATTTKELSNNSLKREIEKTNSSQLKKALEWSENVNKEIAALKEQPCAFKGVYEAVKELSKIADICVVSSANRGAIEEEWNREGLMEYVSLMMDQTFGSKAFCIGELLKAGGYEECKVLMVGDAKGDLKAAESQNVFFYPVLVGKEEFSWKRLKDEGINKLISNEFDGEYQEKLKEEFYNNLKG